MRTKSEPKKKCTTCNNIVRKHWYIVALSLYMLGTSIYGTVELFKLISESLGR